MFNRQPRDRDTESENHTVSDTTTEPESTETEATPRDRTKSGATPKRQAVKRARPPKNPPMTHKEAREQAKANRGPKPDKAARREQAARRREERERVTQGQDRGDPMYDKYHMPRDKGPERLLVRDLVDARRSVGQYFFLIAIVIMFLSSSGLPLQVQQYALVAWVVVLLAFVVDSILLSRKVKRMVWERFPKTTQRKPGLYWYAISRSMMFRRLRMPRPRPGIDYKTPTADLGKHFR
ncbi:Protein of unknown function (DUF3043) [Stackebrandtia albiflava]|uniref:DUF3043 family protein n=1 Tax=Stackebrandtia albiflava TaxID=406432 RepID=A0A562VB90_9ACTN|nr:DUF3043 domain-containing protein [Stackebrandtia albiflava]TWJ15135.1 Protein of unknown function (DUF3043) [Stackebrandtia albiflava]